MASVNLFDNNIFTERFNKLIEQEKSQTAIAEKIGTSRQNIKNWKEGKCTPDIVALFSICKAYNVSADWLIGITDKDIKTSDISIRAMQEYTGLSEAAVNYLIKSKNENDKERRMMSLMIENPWMHSLVNSATEVEYYAEKGIDYLDAYLSYRYSCQEMLTRLIDDILKQEGIFKEEK